MSDIREVTGVVFKLEPNAQGYYKLNIKDENDQWHNNISLGFKQKPKSFDNGDTIKLSYDVDNWSNLVGTPEVIQKKQQGGGNKGGGYQSRGGKGKQGGGYQGKSAGNQDQIMRQSCMGYAATLVAAVAKKTAKPEDLAKETVEIAENILFKYASGGKDGLPEIFGGEQEEPKQEAPKKAPAPKAKSQPKSEPQPEPEGDDDFDDDIPF